MPTASPTYPPGLPRRSSTSRSAPASRSASSASFASSATPLENCSIRSRPVVVPGTRTHVTASIATSARTMLTVRSGPSSPERTVTSTVVPASPLIRSITSSSVSVVIGSPSTATMTSPLVSPALSAGLSRKTPTIRAPPVSVSSTCTPIPTYDPDSESLRDSRSSGVMNVVCPVSPTASVSPSIAPYASSRSSSSSLPTYSSCNRSQASWNSATPSTSPPAGPAAPLGLAAGPNSAGAILPTPTPATNTAATRRPVAGPRSQDPRSARWTGTANAGVGGRTCPAGSAGSGAVRPRYSARSGS